MAAFLDVKKLLRRGAEPLCGDECFDLSSCDFCGVSVPEPVRLCWSAAPTAGGISLSLSIHAVLCAPCSRCLAPARFPLRIEREYTLAESDLREAFPELPVVNGGMLDLRELVYGELVMETPPAVLCGDDCGGLCPA